MNDEDNIYNELFHTKQCCTCRERTSNNKISTRINLSQMAINQCALIVTSFIYRKRKEIKGRGQGD